MDAHFPALFALEKKCFRPVIATIIRKKTVGRSLDIFSK